jgi:hypothetical protein
MSSDSLHHLTPQTCSVPPPRLLDQLRQAARQHGYPEQTRTAWAAVGAGLAWGAALSGVEWE